MIGERGEKFAPGGISKVPEVTGTEVMVLQVPMNQRVARLSRCWSTVAVRLLSETQPGAGRGLV